MSIMSKRQAEDYVDYLDCVKSNAEKMSLEIRNHYDTWEDWTKVKELRNDLRNVIDDLVEFEIQNRWW